MTGAVRKDTQETLAREVIHPPGKEGPFSLDGALGETHFSRTNYKKIVQEKKTLPVFIGG